jgi:hypothetical protein
MLNLWQTTHTHKNNRVKQEQNMFRKIVSNLPFSPALVGQLSFYAKRLRKEETTRRMGLIFTALALVVQSLAVFSPPEAANASTPGKVGDAPRCNVEAVGPRGQAFSISGDKASVSFDVSGSKKCKVQISANSFFAPSADGTPYDKQILHDRNTRVFDTPGRYTMKTTLPGKSNQNKGCFYQVDLTYGTYNVTPVLAFGHGKLDCGTVEVQPSAACDYLSVNRLADGKYTVKGKASIAGSATVNAHVFTIKNSIGTTILRKKVDTDLRIAEFEYAQSTPDTYSANLVVKTSVGDVTAQTCNSVFVVPQVTTTPIPAAVCANVTATITDRTEAYFSGRAQAFNGASIRSYTFIIRNASGTEVDRIVVQSNESSAATSAVALAKAGDYSVQLVVQTSLGDKTDQANCIKQFTISPPEVCQYNPSLPAGSPECQPCPASPDIWIKDDACNAEVIYTKTGTNVTQGNVDATSTKAHSSDKITYTLIAENTGKAPSDVTISDDLTDTLEYATLLDSGGGKLNKKTNTLTWPTVKLEAGEKTSRTIMLQVMKSIPATNTGTTLKNSYDCTMTNTLGNTTDVKVTCPVEKVLIEQTVRELPKTGPGENMLFAGILLAIVAYFYARSRQLGKEVRLVRRSVNAGTI